MEIIIGILFIVAFLAVLLSRKPKALVEAEQAPAAPYKVEAPVEVDQAAVVAAAEGSAVTTSEAPAKKTRKPRVVKAEKAPAKKPAAKKTAAKKTTKSKKA
jgi:hypothetical protein